MANRYFRQFQQTYEVGCVTIYMNVTIGGTGAPTLTVANPNENQGILSMVRTGAGAYTINLVDQFSRLMQIDMHSIVASGLPAAPDIAVVADNSANSTQANVHVQMSLDGVAADPASGEVLLISMVLKNSSV